ncbi:RimK family alpha-L-glutamate ligase [Streptomyces sp. NPDC017546]|uniref:RimK family alpha-L-glutamate ligase n=1 Tax=Streptomyces sp. NPDC017546 TaxID=3365001 RepID=UPI003798771A
MRALRVALVTSRVPEEPDTDLAPLTASLSKVGIEGVALPWDEPVEWHHFDAVLLESPWDYPRRRDAFLAWARQVAARSTLCNPFPVVEWNSDKRYLADLAADGVPIVPSTWTAPGQTWMAPTRGEYVVKPAVSCSAKDTARYRPGEQARARRHAAGLLKRGRTVLTQPYQHAVDTHGELSLIYIDGNYSHAVSRSALLKPGAEAQDGLLATVTITPRSPDMLERDCADAVVKAVTSRFGSLLYARIDFVRGSDGAPLLMECEVIEPSLFLAHSDTAADDLAAALQRRLTRGAAD